MKLELTLYPHALQVIEIDPEFGRHIVRAVKEARGGKEQTLYTRDSRGGRLEAGKLRIAESTQ